MKACLLRQRSRITSWWSALPRAGRLRAGLAALSAVCAAAAVVVLLAQHMEGVAAGRRAEALLKAFTAQPPSAAAMETEAAQAAPPATAKPAPVTPGVARQGGDGDAEKAALEDLPGYTVVARLAIARLSLELPVLSETSAKALNVSVCRYRGPDPGGVGNLVITGHDFRNGSHFGRLDTVEVGDSVMLTDKEGNAFTYEVYKLEHVNPDNAEALDATQYGRELTLLTCEADGNRRLLVRCKIVDT